MNNSPTVSTTQLKNTTTTTTPTHDPATFKEQLHTLPLELRQQILTLFLSTALTTATEKEIQFNTSLRNLYRKTAIRRSECPFHSALQHNRYLPCLHVQDVRCSACHGIHYRLGKLDIRLPNVFVWAEFAKNEYGGFVEAGGVVENMVQEAIRGAYDGRRERLEGEWGWERQLEMQELAKEDLLRSFVVNAKAKMGAKKKKTWAQVVAGG